MEIDIELIRYYDKVRLLNERFAQFVVLRDYKKQCKIGLELARISNELNNYLVDSKK